jgi:hypothetical protein
MVPKYHGAFISQFALQIPMTLVGPRIIASIAIVEDGMKLYLAERRDAIGKATWVVAH